MTYIIKVVSACPEGAVMQTRFIFAYNDRQVAEYLRLFDLYTGYTLIGCADNINKFEMEALARAEEICK
jgi:hypothetical protein